MYKIAARFSERARRIAAEQDYFGRQAASDDPETEGKVYPYCLYEGQECCPQGVMLLVDHPEYVRSVQPRPGTLALNLQSVRDLKVAEARLIEAESLAFSEDWDNNRITDLKEALGVQDS